MSILKTTYKSRSGARRKTIGGYTKAHQEEIADMVSVVRCKECRWIRYCETEDLDMYLDCDKPDGGGIPRNEEWFCADGEREGER